MVRGGYSVVALRDPCKSVMILGDPRGDLGLVMLFSWRFEMFSGHLW